jgi:calpain-7
MYDPNASFFVDPDGTVVAVAVPIPDSTATAPASAKPTPTPPPPQSLPTAGTSPLSAKSHDITQQAAHANARLARALDLDERQETKAAIEEYMSAAEQYLRCIRLVDDEEELQQEQPSIQQSNSTSIKPILKRRLKAALGTIYNGTNDEQIDFIHYMTNSYAPLRADRVEELKHPAVTRRGVIVRELHVSEHRTPESAGASAAPLTADEISVLKRSSLIASGLFLPWADDDAIKLVVGGSTSLFTDPNGPLALSPQQKTRFHKWARPSEIVLLRQRTGLVKTSSPPIMVKAITPYSIRQQYVTDCSFIASLCICASFERRFQKRLVTSILYPRSPQTGLPTYNPAGKYMVKLWLNGVARQVVVDDLLPIDKYGNLLCSHTSLGGSNSNSTLELWVSIIEKAYMKLCT